MLLNSDEIKQKGYVTISEYSKFTQAGVDLSVSKIEVILGGGKVLQDKTEIDPNNYEYLFTTKIGDREIWELSPGSYSCTFNEGISVPNNAMAKITHRSSIYRMGNIIESPWWDAGFYCEKMNTTLIVNNKMIVEKNARLAQVVFYEMPIPSELYTGQFQRKSSAY